MMKDIVAIKAQLHQYERESRTIAWRFLLELFGENPQRFDIATLCLHQMIMFMFVLQEEPNWERKSEYDDYYAFAQRILQGYQTTYSDCAQLQWELCYFLWYVPDVFFIQGETIKITKDGDEIKIRDKIIDDYLENHPDSMLFKYIDQIQSEEKNLNSKIPPDDFFSSSSGLTITRSYKGTNFI